MSNNIINYVQLQLIIDQGLLDERLVDSTRVQPLDEVQVLVLFAGQNYSVQHLKLLIGELANLKRLVFINPQSNFQTNCLSFNPHRPKLSKHAKHLD